MDLNVDGDFESQFGEEMEQEYSDPDNIVDQSDNSRDKGAAKGALGMMISHPLQSKSDLNVDGDFDEHEAGFD